MIREKKYQSSGYSVIPLDISAAFTGGFYVLRIIQYNHLDLESLRPQNMCG